MHLVLALLALFYLLFADAAAETLSVPSEYPTIQAAIDVSIDGDTVLVAPGTWMDEGFYGIDYGGREIVVRSEAGPEATILFPMAETARCFYFHREEGPGAVLEGFTIWYCWFESGAGITCENGASPTLRDLIIVGCGTPHGLDCRGGGLYCYRSSPIVERVQFIGNYAGAGGAVFLDWESGAELRDCRFEGNWACEGGALRIEAASPTISGCVFLDNLARAENIGEDLPGRGGAIHSSLSQTLYENCLIANNVAHRESGAGPVEGGGAYIYLDQSSWEGCTFAGNESPSFAGGNIAISSNVATNLERCIIAFALQGCGICVSSGSPPLLTCCDANGNQEANYYGMPDPTGTNDNISADPLFCDMDALDFTLHVDSPCLPQNSPCVMLIGAYGPGCPSAAMPDEVTVAPTRLLRTMPNPFKTSTTLHFELAAPRRVSLWVLDVTGRRVATLLDAAALGAGTHIATWNGEADDGEPLALGMYVARLETGGVVLHQKLTLLR